MKLSALKLTEKRGFHGSACFYGRWPISQNVSQPQNRELSRFLLILVVYNYM